MAAKKSRSGTKWTEADYKAAGYVQKKLRLTTEGAASLERVAAQLELSQGNTVEELCRRFERKKRGA